MKHLSALVILSQVRTFAVDNKLKYNETQVTNWLEKIIKTTKAVNAKESETPSDDDSGSDQPSA
jgi:hypothetical protein